MQHGRLKLYLRPWHLIVSVLSSCSSFPTPRCPSTHARIDTLASPNLAQLLSPCRDSLQRSLLPWWPSSGITARKWGAEPHGTAIGAGPPMSCPQTEQRQGWSWRNPPLKEAKCVSGHNSELSRGSRLWISNTGNLFYFWLSPKRATGPKISRGFLLKTIEMLIFNIIHEKIFKSAGVTRLLNLIHRNSLNF